MADFDDDEDEQPGGPDEEDDEQEEEDEEEERNSEISEEENAKQINELGLDDRAPQVAGSGPTPLQLSATGGTEDTRDAPPPDPDRYYRDEPVRDLFADSQSFIEKAIAELKQDLSGLFDEAKEATENTLNSFFGKSDETSLVSYETSYVVGNPGGEFQTDLKGNYYGTSVLGEVPVDVAGIPMMAGMYVTQGMQDGQYYQAEGAFLGYHDLAEGFVQTESTAQNLNVQIGFRSTMEEVSISIDISESIDRIGAAYDRAAQAFGEAMYSYERELYEQTRLMNGM
ncbi:hypothetical protein JQ561_03855 [Bradyrhizobium diazoefficiens]|nr:hypothetical protein [Bradyrhizobium diazoefficiens]MBR0925730.1 hypothetical protein [Bradyrhizobium diazoefficiens]